MSDIMDVDDFLAHHGVKGMRWGRHTAGADSGGGYSPSPRAAKKADKKAAQAAKDKEILGARDRVQKKEAQLAELAVKSVDHKTQAGRDAASKAFTKLDAKLNDDPDYVTAFQETGKERFKSNVQLGVLAGLTVAALTASQVLKYK